MPVRHWLMAVAGFALAATTSGTAWAHSGAGSSQATNSTAVREVGVVLSNTLLGGMNAGPNGGAGGGFDSGTAMVTHLTGPQSGRAGAATLKDTALWANVGYTSLSSNNPLTSYDGRAVATFVGIDTRPIDPLTVGIAFGFENVDLNTAFNLGNLQWNGYTVSPYAVVRFLRYFSIDAMVAYSRLNNDVDRLNNAANGSFDSNRWIGGLNLNGKYSIGNWRLGGSIGYLYMHQSDDAYVEGGPAGGARVSGVDTTIGQGRAGLRLGYDFGKIEPYVKGRVEHEFIRPGTQVVSPATGGIVTSDDTGYVVGVGANLRFSNRLTGTIEGTTTQGRDQLDVWGVQGTIRFRF